jgi:CheY-like chemotaxis protein
VMRGDAARLQQVMWNFLSNATRYTPQNGHIQISIEKVGTRAILSVKDDGPGIKADFLPQIFEPFRQADPNSRQANQGLGLGLAIVRNLVESHGGHVEASNRHDHAGAIFRAIFPLTTAAIERSMAPGAPAPTLAKDANWLQNAPSLKGVRVLVVDDEADAREVAALVLERCGASVSMAASAKEAFAIVMDGAPDVLVFDIEMPEEDGYSLVRRIKALPEDMGGDTPAIALTAHAGAQDRGRLLIAGFSRHVPKPFDPLDLVTSVATLAAGRPGLRQKVSRSAEGAAPPSPDGTGKIQASTSPNSSNALAGRRWG